MPITGKQRAQKIDPRYHASRDPYVIRKRMWALFGLMLGLAYSGWLFSKTGASQISPGELSRAHYAWNESGCEKCHTPYVPIREDAFWGSHRKSIQQNNQACNGTCHTMATHFAAATKPDALAQESCSQCHREHLGVHQNLLDVADARCVDCHGDLARVAAQLGVVHSVATRFDDAHPKLSYEQLDKDPGTIKFSHLQHMRPGQPKTPSDGTAKKYLNLPTEFRNQYMDQNTNRSNVQLEDLIQLNCSDCHERDVAPLATGVHDDAVKRSSSHQTYKPVEFEKHCVACHALDGIPHGLGRQQTLQAIDARLPLELFDFFKRRQGERPLEEQEILDRELRLKALATSKTDGCMKCHEPASEDSEAIVLPSRIPVRWLIEGSFTHGAHSMISCKDCHSQAFQTSDDAAQSELHADAIMLPGLASCRECHVQNPKLRAERFLTNPHVASANCVDCHRYHVDLTGPMMRARP